MSSFTVTTNTATATVAGASSSPPPSSSRDDITARLAALAAALRTHPCYTPPWPPGALGFVLESVGCAYYTMTELDNIRDRRPILYAEQIPRVGAGGNHKDEKEGTFDYGPRRAKKGKTSSSEKQKTLSPVFCC